MTRDALRARAAAARPYAIPILSFVVAALLVFAWNGERRATREATRLAESEHLRAEGLTVEVQATKAALRSSVAALTAKDDLLAKALADARRAAPDAQPVEALEVSTGHVAAQGTPRQAPPAAAGTPPAACLLGDGDPAEIRVRQVTLRTDKGNAILVGTAEAWRLSPGEPARIVRGAFSAPLSSAAELAPPPPLGWAFGVSAACSASGCAFGPAVSAPPWRVLGGQVEASAGAPFVGSGVSANASILYRR